MRDMIEHAKEFGVKHITRLGVMKRMLDAGHIDDDKVNRVVEQWSLRSGLVMSLPLIVSVKRRSLFIPRDGCHAIEQNHPHAPA